MNLEAVEKIANAILYEGYLFYPCRRSTMKNQQTEILPGPGYLRNAHGMPDRRRRAVARSEDAISANDRAR